MKIITIDDSLNESIMMVLSERLILKFIVYSLFTRVVEKKF